MERTVKQVVVPLAILSLLGALLFGVGAARNGSLDHWSIFWNLLLAWIPLLCSLLLVVALRHRRWQSPLPLLLTAVWLGFLPNTFYMITDYIHLHDVPRVDGTYDALMFSVIILNGVLLGLASLLLIHAELEKRVSNIRAWRLVLLVLLLVSFAIYIGRYLRWNTWDIITNPAGILFDISERLINPWAHPQTYVTTLTFFAVLSVGYYLLWRTVAILRK